MKHADIHKQRHGMWTHKLYQNKALCVCISTDLIVNNKGGANLKERWMAREMSTDSLLSALLSKDCEKGKEVSVREKL